MGHGRLGRRLGLTRIQCGHVYLYILHHSRSVASLHFIDPAGFMDRLGTENEVDPGKTQGQLHFTPLRWSIAAPITVFAQSVASGVATP